MSRDVSKTQVLGSYGLLVVVAAVVWATIATPFQAKLAQLDTRLLEQQQRKQALDARLSQAERRNAEGLLIDPETVLWRSATATLAATRLRDLIGTLVVDHDGTVHSSIVFDDKDADTVAVSVQFSGDIEQLRAVMHALEAYRPLVFVELLSVRSRTLEGARPKSGNSLLDVQLNASAHFQAAS